MKLNSGYLELRFSVLYTICIQYTSCSLDTHCNGDLSDTLLLVIYIYIAEDKTEVTYQNKSPFIKAEDKTEGGKKIVSEMRKSQKKDGKIRITPGSIDIRRISR